MSCKVVLLCQDGNSSLAVANALRQDFADLKILVEEKEPRKVFLKRRLKRLGAGTVAGQIAFTQLVAPLLRRRSKARIDEILQKGGISLDRRAFDGAFRVSSVNSPEAVEWLRRERPDVVVVNGTRIIARRVLEATSATFINTHCGITPEYRGCHGAYWALRDGDPERCGVTVHLVDAGIDTGDILAQATITPEPGDNFATYPYLQLATAIPLLLESVRLALHSEHSPHRRETTSGLWYHPTIWQYLATGLKKSVW